MEIAKDRVAGIEYTLKDDEGKIVDSNVGQEPLVYLHGHGNLVPGLERELVGKKAGDLVEVVVKPEDGYGVRDESRTFEVPRSSLPQNIEPTKGMQLTMRSPNGHAMPVTVAKVKLSSVVLDGNHPLAGQNLHFTVTVQNVRKATREELEHGHAHSPGHHHH
jgi:FKBP-type peptidyl-prolyl cis-trans isomerase SlyD